jgi:hypothetical protein
MDAISETEEHYSWYIVLSTSRVLLAGVLLFVVCFSKILFTVSSLNSVMTMALLAVAGANSVR